MSGFAVLVAVALVSPGPSTSFVCNYPGARLCGDGRHAVDFGDPRVVDYSKWKCVPNPPPPAPPAAETAAAEIPGVS